MRLVIGISGASGVWLGYKLLQILKSYTDIETHLVITEGAIKNFALETTLDIAEVLKLADFLMPIITWEHLLQVDHLLQMEW